ncbi:PQQ-binding-like beta-propeller repeat protein, partial [Armatimonas sp.]|uniref:outer membrane protein assembly factor BamB family protein n=1 Tax=Armatimonas sp. TaxID=1872638 RepID=UPI003753B834
MKRNALLATTLLALSAGALITRAADWPYWGGGPSRNMVSSETNIATSWDAGRYKGSTEEIDLATTKNVKWVAKLGSQSYGNPTVSGGKIFVGTNNESPRDEKLKGDRAVLLCLDEKTGDMVWQLAVPKLGTGKVSDWEFLGLCSSPAVDGDKVYVVTNRCEVICLDVNGQANGNQGVQDEAKYLTDKGKPPHTLGAKDADVLWRFDMREELGVFPHNITNCGPLILGNTITVTTSNGVDWTHTNIPNPKAPALCVLDKNTGKYLGEENSGVSAKTMHSNWSSPAGGLVNGKETIIFGGGDGICYAFDPASAVGGDQSTLKTLWKYDCNPPEYRMKAGKPLKYATFDGPSEVIATPVLYKNRVYVPIGQDPEHGEGIGQMACIDAITGKTLWVNKSIHRSLSTPSIINGMVFVADYSGFVHCLDSETGKLYWSFDSKSHIWGSTMVTEGKVYAGTEDGDIIILAASKVMKELGRVDMRAPIYASPVIANGTLYVGTPTHLYA